MFAASDNVNCRCHDDLIAIALGLQELKGTLPGPASSSCGADFPAADFQSVDLWWDKWYGRDTISAMFQPTGASVCARACVCVCGCGVVYVCVCTGVRACLCTGVRLSMRVSKPELGEDKQFMLQCNESWGIS